MNSFNENAFYLLVWRTILVTLIGVILLLTHPLELGMALLAAGNISLLFSIVLITCAARLTEDRIAHSDAWRLLPPTERPFGPGGRRWACNRLREQMLRFAKGGSIVAIISSVSSLMLASE